MVMTHSPTGPQSEISPSAPFTDASSAYVSFILCRGGSRRISNAPSSQKFNSFLLPRSFSSPLHRLICPSLRRLRRIFSGMMPLKIQAPLNLLMGIRGFTLKKALTLPPQTKPNRLPTLVAIRSMASKYTRFQANKSPAHHLHR